MYDKNREPWYKDGLAFSCIRGCGICCKGPGGYVWVSEEEIQTLAKALDMPLDEFCRKMLRRTNTGLALVDGPTGDCPLLDRTNGCRVYQARPLQCRTWPWWRENLASPAAWNDAARRCPGMNHGAIHSRFVIEAESAKEF